MAYLKTAPYALHRQEGHDLKAFGALILVKATSEQTGGSFNLFEVSCPPDFATPLHIHYVEDVAVYVLEGTLTLYWGDTTQEAVAGSYLFQPRGTPHGFRVKGGTSARFLYMTIPAGFDRFAAEQGLPAPRSGPEAGAARYKIEILGPLPE